MMELVLALGLIVLLYARTFKYKRLIDDIVPMSGYLYDVPQSAPAPDFFTQRTPTWHRVLAIGCHLLNTWLVYLLLGGKAALLFAVFPVSVNNVAWITGSYYSCTTMLTLISFYFLTHVVWWAGAPLAMFAFGVALNTTVATIAFPFAVLVGSASGLFLLIPLAGFLLGKRFTTGKKIREVNAGFNKISPDVFTVGRLATMTKVVAHYLYLAIVPMKMLFFRKFGEQYRFDPAVKADLDSFNLNFFAALGLIISFLVLGYVLDMFFWAAWFIVLISAFSQYKMLGQFFAERYMYPAVVGICAIFALLPEQLYWMLVGLYVMRTHMFIPAFESNKTLYENGVAYKDESPNNWCNLSDWYLMVERDLTLAGYYIQENIKRAPMDYKPYVNFASLWRMLKNYPVAMQNLLKAKECAEGLASPHVHAIIDQQIAWTQMELDGKSPGILIENPNVKKE